MCMGGGAKAAKINTHKKQTKRANKQLNRVVAAIDRISGSELMSQGTKADDTPLLAAQQLLNSSNSMLSGVLGQASQLQEAAANSQAMVSQNAAQMAALVGPPPPEKTATKVVVGKARGVETESDRNRRSLRIDVPSST